MQENEKRGSARLAMKSGAWYVISTFLVRSLSFLTTPLFARLLSREAYGEFSNFASWQAVLIIITGMELQNTVARAYYDFKDDFDQYISSITLTCCGITLAIYALFLICGKWIYQVVSIPSEYVHILFVLLLFMGCKQIFFARERTLYHYKSVAVISFANLLTPTIIALVLVVLAAEEQRLSARIYGFYVPSALLGAVCAGYMLRKGRVFRWKYCKYAIVMSIPLMAHYLTAYLLTSSNTIITKMVMGAEYVSLVSIASSANHILTLLLQAVSGAVTTWLMDNLEQKNIGTVRKGTLLYVLGVSFVAVAVMVVSPELILILGGSQYADSVLLMPGMVASVLIQNATTIFTIILTYEKKIVKTAAYTAIVSLLTVVAKYFLLPHMGLQILPYINIVAFGVLMIINYILVCQCGCGSCIYVFGIFSIIVVVLIVMGCCFFLYNHIVLRYAVIACGIVVCAVVAYVKRQQIAKLISTRKKK